MDLNVLEKFCLKSKIYHVNIFTDVLVRYFLSFRGGVSVVSDYGRSVLIGEKLSALAPKLVYVASAIMLATLLHFEYNDIGLTRAFELVFNL